MTAIYAVLLLSEADAELNEANLTSVLEAAGHSVTDSRIRALVAALEGVDRNVDRTYTHEDTGTARETATVDADDESRSTADRSTTNDTDEVS